MIPEISCIFLLPRDEVFAERVVHLEDPRLLVELPERSSPAEEPVREEAGGGGAGRGGGRSKRLKPMLLLSFSLPRQPCALPTLARRARPLSAAAVRDAGCERRLLRGVLAEALEKQRRKRFALTEQSGALERSQLPSEAKARAKAVARAEALPLLLRECDAAEAALSDLHARLYERRPDLPALRRAMEELGLEQRLELYDVDRAAMDQWGRPAG